jgi:hypothetical protein
MDGGGDDDAGDVSGEAVERERTRMLALLSTDRDSVEADRNTLSDYLESLKERAIVQADFETFTDGYSAVRAPPSASAPAPAPVSVVAAAPAPVSAAAAAPSRPAPVKVPSPSAGRVPAQSPSKGSAAARIPSPAAASKPKAKSPSAAAAAPAAVASRTSTAASTTTSASASTSAALSRPESRHDATFLTALPAQQPPASGPPTAASSIDAAVAAAVAKAKAKAAAALSGGGGVGGGGVADDDDDDPSTAAQLRAYQSELAGLAREKAALMAELKAAEAQEAAERKADAEADAAAAAAEAERERNSALGPNDRDPTALALSGDVKALDDALAQRAQQLMAIQSKIEQAIKLAKARDPGTARCVHKAMECDGPDLTCARTRTCLLRCRVHVCVQTLR